ncbi:MAG: hypothetical protein ACEPOZ_09180 [Marinifilaceae bacterium]
MKLKLPVLILALSIGFAACQSTSNKKNQTNENARTVLEVLQANSYTYLNLKESNKTYWVAIPKKEVKVGDKVYHEQGLEMTNFKSKDLQRTFASIYFLQGVSSTPVQSPSKYPEAMMHAKKSGTSKKNISIDVAPEGISIAELYANRNKYANKTVKIRGQVVKFNSGIMGKNWAHLQDGTDSKGNYDITVTTNEMVKVDEIVTFKGRITLNKDFGAGYSYEVIMEEASKLN